MALTSDGDARFETQYPMTVKLAGRVPDARTLTSFLDWLRDPQGGGVVLAEEDRSDLRIGYQLRSTRKSDDDLFDKYFGIDRKAYDREQERMRSEGQE